MVVHMQADPPPQQPAPININIDLSGLAGLIWQWFIDHIGDVGNAVWTSLLPNLPAVAGQVLTLLEDALRNAAQAIWNAAWGSSANIVTQLPADLTYNAIWYRSIATDPLPVAAGGATLALVLLGLRTLLGSMVGRDHVITHVSGRLIPAVFLTLAYPVLIARGAGLINAAATALGSGAIGGGLASGLGTLLTFQAPPQPSLLLPYALLWLLLIYYGVRLVIRLAYSVFRLLVALVFGPVALILYAIPQTEWVTWFWLRELVGWATTPLLVTACLAMAIPLASGRSGFLAAAVFGIAGLQAAYDLVGLLGHGGAGGRLFPFTFATARMGAAAVTAGGAGAGVAAASIPAGTNMTHLADRFGYQ
jgi:hypothetical protein